MNMEVPTSEQNPAQVMHEVEPEIEDIRKSVRQGTEQADSGQVVPASEVFSELRQRNGTGVKWTG